MRSHRKYLTCLALPALLGLAMVGRPGAPSARTAERPNILLILVDDLGYGDLSSYGAPDLRTPNIDALVAAGMRFDRFYANCPVCSPTRAALLTGRYPDLVGVPGVIRTHPENDWGDLSDGVALLPERLGEAGYHSAIVGKWHLGLEEPDTPLDRGFDRFRGFLGDMMDDYYDHRRHDINYMREGREEIDPEGHATDLFSDWAVDFIKSREGEDEPFFLYLAYNAPHTPIQPPDDWLARVEEREPEISDERARLVALIEHLDAGIGRVLEALEATGQKNDTLVIFTSDNGGQLGVGARCGPLRGGKGDLYEGGIRVPMAAAWPGHIEPGSRSDAVALSMDLFPTLCEAAGAPTGEIDGVSLLPTLLGEGRGRPDDDRDLVWVRREGGTRYLGQEFYALRRGRWKLVQNHPFEPFQLYHLASDPREQRDVAEEHDEVYRRLAQALMGHIQRAGAVPWQEPAAIVTPEARCDGR